MAELKSLTINGKKYDSFYNGQSSSIINVKNVILYGAAGDGVTDDTDAIATAIAALGPGETLYFPKGVYRVSNIDLKSDMTVQGDGWSSVIQLLDGTTDYSGRNNCLNIENINNVIVRDIKLDGTRLSQWAEAASQDGRLNGIHIRKSSDITVENVWMYNNGYHGCIMTYAKNVVFERCRASDNGFRPIHGHTQIYNCRVSGCVCENNGLGQTKGSGSGFENDSIFFFGAENVTISDNVVKSNRRGCITVGPEQDSTGEDIIPSRNITISGNVCECYEDLAYVPTAESDTGVAKFSSMGIVVYGGKHTLENVTVTGNTIRNAHEAIYLYSAEGDLAGINATITGNSIQDCSYGIYATNVADITIASNQLRNLAIAWMYAGACSNWLVQGNNVNATENSEDFLCKLQNCTDVVLRGNNLNGGCENAIYAPASNTRIIVANNTMKGFTGAAPVTNPNGKVTGNLYITEGGMETKVCIDPYEKTGFVRSSLVNPNTTSTNWYYTSPAEIKSDDLRYVLNTYTTIPTSYTDPYTYDQSAMNTAIVFLEGTDLATAVGIANLTNGNGEIVYSENCIEGDTNNIWGVQISLEADKARELWPTATHVMMQVQAIYKEPDSLGGAYHDLNDGHAYVYRSQTGSTVITGDKENDNTSPNVDLTGYATEAWVREEYQPKGNYLTEHQDISGKLDADKLSEAINDALAQAKESGEFDGSDYVLTAADKAEIAGQIEGATLVQAPTYVDSVDKMTDTSKVYVLAETGHIWAYMDTTTIEEVQDTISLIDNSRLGSDGSTATDATAYAGYVATDYIDLLKYPLPFKIHLDGASFSTAGGATYEKIATYTEAKAKILSQNNNNTIFHQALNAGGSWPNTVEVDTATGFVTITFNTKPLTNNSTDVKYLRLSGQGEPDTVDVYVTYETEVSGGHWTDTGTTYAPTLTEADKQAMVDEVATMVDTQLLTIVGDGVVTV